jgi:hypothetical protein
MSNDVAEAINPGSGISANTCTAPGTLSPAPTNSCRSAIAKEVPKELWEFSGLRFAISIHWPTLLR